MSTQTAKMGIPCHDTGRWVVLTGFILICLLCGTVGAFSGAGSGTALDPWQITTPAQLWEINASLSSSYKIMNDLDLSAYSWQGYPLGHQHGWRPIGSTNNATSGAAGYNYFTGVLDGNYHTITGLYFNGTCTITASVNTDYTNGDYGLFAALGASTVKNLVFLNTSIVPTGTANCQPGVVNGLDGNNAVISNVSVYNGKVLVSGTQATSRVGAFGGRTPGTITISNSVVAMDCIGASSDGTCTGTVQGSEAGVFGGRHDAGTYTLIKTLAATKVLGKTGGLGAVLTGYREPTTAINVSWDNSTYGTGTLFYATQMFTNLTHSQAQTQSSYTSWDFVNIWKMSDPSGVFKGYPIYQWMGDIPVASFNKDKTGGTSPLTVIFTDTSVNVPLNWNWVFGDGSNINATQQNPIHTFTGAGTYNVNLTVSNTYGVSTSATQSITVGEIPTVSFTKVPVFGNSPLTVQFTDTSSQSPSSFYWEFGDGDYSNAQNPSHTYINSTQPPQFFSVFHSATNSYGTGWHNVTNAIQLTEVVPTPIFTPTPTMNPNQTVQGNATIEVSKGNASQDLMAVVSTSLIIGLWVLFLYLAETKRDIGYTFFMMIVSAISFSDTLLTSVRYSVYVVGQQANLPLLMVFVSCYEVIMTLLLMNKIKQRKKENGND
jgi:PKD repeat protein